MEHSPGRCDADQETVAPFTVANDKPRTTVRPQRAVEDTPLNIMRPVDTSVARVKSTKSILNGDTNFAIQIPVKESTTPNLEHII